MIYICTPTCNRKSYLINLLKDFEKNYISSIFWIIRDNSSKKISKDIFKIINNSKSKNNIYYISNNQNVGPRKNYFLLFQDFLNFSKSNIDKFFFLSDDDTLTADGWNFLLKKEKEKKENKIKSITLLQGIQIQEKNKKKLKPCYSRIKFSLSSLPSKIERMRILSGLLIDKNLAKEIKIFYHEQKIWKKSWYPMQIWALLADRFITKLDKFYFNHTVGNEIFWTKNLSADQLSKELTFERFKTYNMLINYFLLKKDFQRKLLTESIKKRYLFRTKLIKKIYNYPFLIKILHKLW
jgi:hypothetical protein